MSEMISNVNIPSCQVMIGMGVPLHRIPDIRRMFGLDPGGETAIDFEADAQVPPHGVQSQLHYNLAECRIFVECHSTSNCRCRLRMRLGILVWLELPSSTHRQVL